MSASSRRSPKSKLLKIDVCNFGRESAISGTDMVTAAAPALPDSHALSQAAVGTACSSARPFTSFQSVYQSSLLPGDSVPQLENSKVAASKKVSSKNTNDTLPAPVSFTAATSPSERPWTPALPSFSVKANASNTEPEPATREVPQSSMSEQSQATPGLTERASNTQEYSLSASTQDRPSNLIQSAVASSRNASAIKPQPAARQTPQSSMSKLSLETPDLAKRADNVPESSLPISTQDPSSNLIRSAVTTSHNASATEPEPAAREVAQLSMSEQEAAALDRLATLKHSAVADTVADTSSVSSSITAGAANATVASTRQLAASREPAFNLQAPTSTPSYLLGAPSVPQVSQVESSLESRQPANSSRTSQTSTSQQPSVDPALFTKGLAAALAPQNGNLAFSLKIMESTLQARHAQQVAQPELTDRNQAATQIKSAEHSPAALLAPNATHATSSPMSPAAIPGEVAAAAATVSPVWNEAAAAPQLDVSPDTQLSEPHQPANLSTVAALHDAQPILPESPRPSAISEILLQLGGKDQAAAIRVTDRAGAVNVSVHATDPDLRSSLRSNLGDLASQLTHQGWKTEVVKPGTTLTRGETSQDPHQDGQRSPGQQQPSSQGERQPQRDRRASSGQWLATFEEQASGNSGNPGGTN
jgi:hypothetical protein